MKKPSEAQATSFVPLSLQRAETEQCAYLQGRALEGESRSLSTCLFTYQLAPVFCALTPCRSRAHVLTRSIAPSLLQHSVQQGPDKQEENKQSICITRFFENSARSEIMCSTERKGSDTHSLSRSHAHSLSLVLFDIFVIYMSTYTCLLRAHDAQSRRLTCPA